MGKHNAGEDGSTFEKSGGVTSEVYGKKHEAKHRKEDRDASAAMQKAWNAKKKSGQ